MSVIIQHVHFCLFGWRDRRRYPDFFCFMFTYYIYTQEKCELILWHLLVSWIWHTVLLLLVNFPFPPFPLPWSFFNLLNEKQDVSTQVQPHWTWNFPNLVELDSQRREQFVFTFFPAQTGLECGGNIGGNGSGTSNAIVAAGAGVAVPTATFRSSEWPVQT